MYNEEGQFVGLDALGPSSAFAPTFFAFEPSFGPSVGSVVFDADVTYGGDGGYDEPAVPSEGGVEVDNEELGVDGVVKGPVDEAILSFLFAVRDL